MNNQETPELKFIEQKKEMVLAVIIPKKVISKKTSRNFTLLAFINLLSNIRKMEELGDRCCQLNYFNVKDRIL